MKVTMKELFNASFDALDVSVYAATIVTEGNKEVRFYIWLNDVANEIVMQQEFNNYETLFDAFRLAPISDDNLVQLLKHINRYERYWKQTSEGIWRTDEEMLAFKDEIENTTFEDDEEDDDYDHNQFSFPFLNGTLITANSGEDGITVNVISEDDEPKIGTFTSFEDMLYGIAPTIQENSQSEFELGFVARRLKVSFDSEMEAEEIIEILLK